MVELAFLLIAYPPSDTAYINSFDSNIHGGTSACGVLVAGRDSEWIPFATFDLTSRPR